MGFKTFTIYCFSLRDFSTDGRVDPFISYHFGHSSASIFYSSTPPLYIPLGKLHEKD